MPLDSEPILSNLKPPDAFTSMFVDGISGLNIKICVLLFLAFIILNSDIFIMRILSRFEGATDYKYPTNFGTTLQGLFLCLFYMFLDTASRQKIM